MYNVCFLVQQCDVCVEMRNGLQAAGGAGAAEGVNHRPQGGVSALLPVVVVVVFFFTGFFTVLV